MEREIYFTQSGTPYRTGTRGEKVFLIEKKCEFCGKEFYTRPVEHRQGRGRFCSIVCANKSRFKAGQILPTTGHSRAQKMYPLGDCEMCGNPAVERHHKDGDVGNNSRENILICCRRCHMVADGRIEKLKATRKPRRIRRKDCVICGQEYFPLRKGRCSKCEYYFRSHGTERPRGIPVRQKGGNGIVVYVEQSSFCRECGEPRGGR